MFAYYDEVSSIATKHGGFISSKMIEGAGLPKLVARSAANRGWKQIQRGLWFTGDEELQFEQWLQAGLLIGGHAAAIGSAASLFIRGVLGEQPAHIDIWVPGEKHPTPVKHSPLRFHRDHVDRLSRRDAAGPLLSMADSLLDYVAMEHSNINAAAAIINGRRISSKLEEHVRETIRLRRRQKRRQLLEELIMCSPPYDSVLEYLWVQNVERPHHIRPSTRQWVSPDNYRHDGAWEDLRTIYELDGDAYHNDAKTRRRDAEKDHQARRHGFTILRFHYADVAYGYCKTAAHLAATVHGLTASPCSSACWVNT